VTSSGDVATSNKATTTVCPNLPRGRRGGDELLRPDPRARRRRAGAVPDAGEPVLAALYRRDLELHAEGTCYALIAERAGATIAASALIA
jgi:hypothetical protein